MRLFVRQHHLWMRYSAISRFPGVLVLPPLLFGGALASGLLLHWLLPVYPLPSLPARLLGIMLLVASGLLAYSAERAMKHAGSNSDIGFAALASHPEDVYRNWKSDAPSPLPRCCQPRRIHRWVSWRGGLDRARSRGGLHEGLRAGRHRALGRRTYELTRQPGAPPGRRVGRSLSSPEPLRRRNTRTSRL